MAENNHRFVRCSSSRPQELRPRHHAHRTAGDHRVTPESRSTASPRRKRALGRMAASPTGSDAIEPPARLSAAQALREGGSTSNIRPGELMDG
ncbi:hypothetical protein BV133_3296 [Blastochloris viridis]|uniref:Uncharacterized protein n=1 Tax=Blastochloris viridis TaxID=1079 RepID=A0A182D5Z6_BLAVI|nr:hypothetical protein BV133_3296 [Blastochloris viridis]